MEMMDSTKVVNVQEIVGVIVGIKSGEDIQLLEGRGSGARVRER
jgi:hypothetical protein